MKLPLFHSNDTPKIGLALGSGGARGLAHIGVISRLSELGIKPMCISGCSIGAIVGAIYACGHFTAMEEFVKTMDWKRSAQLFLEFNLPRSGFLTGKQISSLFRRDIFIGNATFESLAMPFSVIATDLETEEPIVINKGNIADAVRASMSIPGIFEPVVFDGKCLIDGGLSEPLPIKTCYEMGATAVIAVDVNLRKSEEFKEKQFTKPPSIFGVMTQTVRLMENQITRKALEQGAPDVLIQPAVGLINTLEFYRNSEAIAAGRQAVDEQKDELLRLLK